MTATLIGGSALAQTKHVPLPGMIKALINARGGLRREWLWKSAAEFHKLGFPAC